MSEGEKAVRYWRSMIKIRNSYRLHAARGHQGSMRQLDMMEKYVEAAFENVQEEAKKGDETCMRLVEVHTRPEPDTIPF